MSVRRDSRHKALNPASTFALQKTPLIAIPRRDTSRDILPCFILCQNVEVALSLRSNRTSHLSRVFRPLLSLSLRLRHNLPLLSEYSFRTWREEEKRESSEFSDVRRYAPRVVR
jgi:hypothetical protein